MLEKPEKKIWVKTRFTIFFSHFQILRDFAGSEAYYIVMGKPAPKTGQKAQPRPKKRVLGITLARQNVFTCLFGFIFEAARPF